MKRVGRIIYKLATALSLLCSLALQVWLSGRSEMIWMGWSFRHTFEIGWHDGRIFAGDQMIVSSPAFNSSHWTFHHVEAWRDDDGWSGAPGIFRWDFKPPQESWYVIHPRYVSAPCWLVVVITGILPLAKLPRFIRWFSRDEVAGHCPKCGHDLRATSDRFPECGRVPTQARDAS